MESKNNIIAGVAVFALIVAGIGLYRPVAVNVSIPDINVPPAQVLAGAAGTTHTEEEQFLGGIFLSNQTDLDNVLPALTSSTNGTLTAAIICNEPVVDVRLPLNNQTITFPSSSLIFDRCLNRLGYRELFIHNASGSGNFTLGESDASTTIKLLTLTTSSVASPFSATSTLQFGDIAKVTLVRTATSTPTDSRWLDIMVQVMR